MVGRRVLALITILIAILALLGAPEVEARRHRHRGAAGRTRRCHSDKGCRGGTCNDAGQCCTVPAVACGAGCCDAQHGGTCCGSACVDTQIDNSNCGGCDSACIGGTECQDGVCACPHTTDVICNDGCVNLLFDDANCGACGNACAADRKCFIGRCGCTDPTKLLCNGQCLDGFSDPNNCGSCGNVCPADQPCIGGTCVAPCSPCEELAYNVCVLKDPDKDTVCNGLCVDARTDPNNCGGCGTVCPSGIPCTNGTCDYCGVGYTTCHPPDPNRAVGCCRQDIAPVCCESSIGGGCCTTDATCCDGYCCPAGTQCCINSRHTYPCIAPGQPCQG